ncbi:MAG: type II secretion system protein [Lentisphaeria bacterium]
MNKNNKQFTVHSFSLIELLIVIGILGSLLTLVLPGFNDTSDDAKDKVAKTEMREVQKAFQRFCSDMVLRSEARPALNGLAAETASNKKLYDIALYGLWPLLCDVHPVLSSDDDGYLFYDAYDADTAIGRRAPYLEQEGLVAIFSVTITEAHSSALSCGQENKILAEDGSVSVAPDFSRRVPVVKDPYGGYYRVLCPVARTDSYGHDLLEFRRLQKMVLVCTGPNQKLETFPDSFDVDDPHPSVADEIIAGGDDLIVRLMPMAGF